MRKCLITLLILLLHLRSTQAATKVSIFVSPHPDDWQLFMGVNAYNAIASSNDSSRVIIIYVTAGDYSDFAYKADSIALPYYQAREKGAENSVTLAANSHKKKFDWVIDTVRINGHLIRRATYHFTTSYFLRLADGGSDGLRSVSLKNFREGHFADNYSIDSLTSYPHWDDLANTCKAIVAKATEGIKDIELHIPDTSQEFNPGDHSDHYESARLFSGVLNHKKLSMLLYEGYISGNADHPANLKGADIVKESGLFAAYVQGMVDNGYPSIWNTDYLRFCDNCYYRKADGQLHNKITSCLITTLAMAIFALAIAFAVYHLLRRK